jgi:hypothetical protein
MARLSAGVASGIVARVDRIGLRRCFATIVANELPVADVALAARFVSSAAIYLCRGVAATVAETAAHRIVTLELAVAHFVFTAVLSLGTTAVVGSADAQVASVASCRSAGEAVVTRVGLTARLVRRAAAVVRLGLARSGIRPATSETATAAASAFTGQSIVALFIVAAVFSVRAAVVVRRKLAGAWVGTTAETATASAFTGQTVVTLFIVAAVFSVTATVVVWRRCAGAWVGTTATEAAAASAFTGQSVVALFVVAAVFSVSTASVVGLIRCRIGLELAAISATTAESSATCWGLTGESVVAAIIITALLVFATAWFA